MRSVQFECERNEVLGTTSGINIDMDGDGEAVDRAIPVNLSIEFRVLHGFSLEGSEGSLLALEA